MVSQSRVGDLLVEQALKALTLKDLFESLWPKFSAGDTSN
jgi:hypothetical protein